MTEWSMPVNRQVEHDELIHQLEHDPRWKQIQSFMGGGFWRNFKVKYPETNEMYSRMMYVSSLLQKATEQGCNPAALELAQDHLYQGQCNCSYWHGAFGGIYLPHLRNAVYFHLLTAEAALEKALGRPEKWVEATNEDYDFDGLQEIQLYHEKVRQGENENSDEAASIHDRIVFKQADLDKQLFYDTRMPNILVDHFWDEDVDVESISQ